MSVAELPVDRRDPRAVLADALHTWMTDEQVMYLIDEVLSIDKRVRGEIDCPSCNNHFSANVHIPDAKAVVSALTDLLSQGFGRPGEAKIDDSAIVFKRLTAPEEVTKNGGSRASKRPVHPRNPVAKRPRKPRGKPGSDADDSPGLPGEPPV